MKVTLDWKYQDLHASRLKNSALGMDKLSHKIFLIRCDILENVASLPIVEPITP